MSRYIDAEAFKRKLIDEKSFFPAIVARALEEMPTLDVEVEEAIEKQKPKRVINLLYFRDGAGGYCPNCNGTVEKRDTFLRRIRKSNYCTWCGQSLDWVDYPIGKDGE